MYHLVHRDSELCSPLCEAEGEYGVHSHCGDGHGGVGGATGDGQDPLDEGELKDGGDNIEYQGREHEADGTRSTVLGENFSLMIHLILPYQCHLLSLRVPQFVC